MVQDYRKSIVSAIWNRESYNNIIFVIQFFLEKAVDTYSNYKYEDGNCVIHTFMPTNIHNIYHDVTQPGLVLTIENGSYYITDDKLTKLSFNSSGRLISIAYKRTDTYTAYLNIRYENDKITKLLAILFLKFIKWSLFL